MEFYDLETEFTFGKYKGKTLEEVFNVDPAFVDHCLVAEASFLISDDTMDQLREVNPTFEFSEKALDKREEKFDKWESEDDDAEDEDDFYDEDLEEFDSFEADEEEEFKTKGRGKKDYDDFDDDFDSEFDDFDAGYDDDDYDDDY